MSLLGCVDTVSRRLVEGWAIVAERPDDVLRIEIRVDANVAGTVDADVPRPDLKEFVPHTIANPRGFRFVFDPPLSPFRPVEIAVSVVGCAEELANARRAIAAPHFGAAPITPIIITSTGRSGTTLLMREFLAHPDIAVADLFPYEIKLCAYYASAFRSLTANEDRENSTNPEEMFDGSNRHHIGHNPYNSPGFFKITSDQAALETLFENTIPHNLGKIFRDAILEYYDVLRKGQDKAAARFFAEKGDIDIACRDGTRMFFGTIREIVLVRDPRDLLCSAKAFWKLGSDDALETLGSMLDRLAEIGASPQADTHILRYEDLIEAPEATRGRLYAFLGTSNHGAAATGDAMFEQHGTSPDARSSVGRWQHDLSAKEVAACDQRFAVYMRTFGYPGSASVRAVQPVQLLAGLVAEQALKRWSRAGSDVIQVIEFNAEHPENACFLEGFSALETASVWSSAQRCTIRLPPLRFRPQALSLVFKPYVSTGEGSPLPRQRMTLTINGRRLDTCTVDGFSVVTCGYVSDKSPRRAAIEIVLELPDACRPIDFEPGHTDARLLGIELHKVVLHGSPDAPA